MPLYAVDTLVFPALTDPACSAANPSSTCGAGNNDLTGLSANAISIEAGTPSPSRSLFWSASPLRRSQTQALSTGPSRSLEHSGLQVEGRVTAYDRGNHNSCSYVYVAAGGSYSDTDSCDNYSG